MSAIYINTWASCSSVLSVTLYILCTLSRANGILTLYTVSTSVHGLDQKLKKNFFRRPQKVSILRFAGHVVSFPSIQLCQYSVKAQYIYKYIQLSSSKIFFNIFFKKALDQSWSIRNSLPNPELYFALTYILILSSTMYIISLENYYQISWRQWKRNLSWTLDRFSNLSYSASLYINFKKLNWICQQS